MGNEFRINAYGDNWQTHPDVAVLTDGSFIVVWDSFYSEDNADFNYIAAQRFAADGTRVGGEFVVDSDIAGDSYYATVAALNDGGYAVAWQNSIGSPVVDGADVFARSFDANGTARGGSDRVNSGNEEYQYAADIVATENGGFAVGFTSSRGAGESQHDDILLQLYDAGGNRRGTNTTVNQITERGQEDSKSAVLSNGNIVVIWDAEWAGVGTGGQGGIDQVHGRIVRPDGTPKTDDFVVSDENDGHYPSIVAPETSISVAALPGGRFVATWHETTLIDGTSDVTFDIHARIFDAKGRPDGKAFVVERSTEAIPEHTEIVALTDGGFVVAWDSFGVGGAANQSDVFARAFDDDGRALGGAFRVNQLYVDSNQEEPSLAALAGGGFVAVYHSEGIDGSYEGIAGRIFGQGTDGNDAEALMWAGTFRAFGGDDRITGTNEGDRIFGDDGNDWLAGAAARTRLSAATVRTGSPSPSSASATRTRSRTSSRVRTRSHSTRTSSRRSATRWRRRSSRRARRLTTATTT